MSDASCARLFYPRLVVCVRRASAGWSRVDQCLDDPDTKNKPEPPSSLAALAAECLFDVGAARVEGDLLGEARRRLKRPAGAPFNKGDKASVLLKVMASNALARLDDSGRSWSIWSSPYGEPRWITIQAGEFSMRSDGEYRFYKFSCLNT